MDILSFILGFIIGLITVTWGLGIFMSGAKVFQNAKEGVAKLTQKKAVIVKKKEDIDILLASQDDN